MNNFHKHNRLIRFTGIVAVIIFGFLSILGSGGGGDDGGDGGGITVGLLPSYDFGIDRGYYYTGQTTGINVTVSSIPIEVRVDPHPLAGTVNCDQTTNMCAPSTIKTQTIIDLYDGSPTPLLGNLSITIPVQLSIGSNGKPESGTIKIALVPSVPEEYIELEMTTCPSGAGVNISYNGVPYPDAENSCFTFDDLEQLVIDSSTDQVLVVAVFGYRVIGFLFEQLHFTTEVLSIIGDYAADLEQYYYIEEPCDSFSAAGFTAPSGVSDQGNRGISWTDENTDGSLGPGDSFFAGLYNCWVSPDQLLDGTIEFLGYVENINTQGQITAIGFTSDTQAPPGGVFPYLSMSETEETTPNTMEITNVIGITGGGFSILFNAPAP